MDKLNKLDTIKSDRIKIRKERKDRVISLRVPQEVYDRYEVRCLENRTTMTMPLREALMNYI